MQQLYSKNLHQQYYIFDIKLLQQNCAKSQNVMILVLEYAVQNRIDVLMLQEPYYDETRQKSIDHFNYYQILPKIAGKRSRVMIYIAKFNAELQCTNRQDLIDNADMQIVNIQNQYIQNYYLINLYNEKN